MYLAPNSPEALEVARRVGQKDREDHADSVEISRKAAQISHSKPRPVPTRTRIAKISDETKQRVIERRALGISAHAVSIEFGISEQSVRNIEKQHRKDNEMANSKGKAPAVVADHAEAHEKVQPDYTTLNLIKEEADRMMMIMEVRAEAVKAVSNLIKNAEYSPLYDYRKDDPDGEYHYVLKHPGAVAEVERICNLINGGAV